MTVSMLNRFLNFRRLNCINNNVALFLDSGRYLNYITSRLYTSTDETKSIIENIIKFETREKKPEKKISKAMFMYLQRAKEHDEFMKKEITEYEIGKRHLANMMGEDPEFFTQADVERSIQYLFPSGIYDPKARPIMEHPSNIFPNRKAAEFDETGRPFHSMFYTTKPNYYQTLYDIVDKIKSLNNIEDSLIRQGIVPMNQIDLVGSTWKVKSEIEKQFFENISDYEYDYLITSLKRLCDHPLSKRATDFITNYRKILNIYVDDIVISPLEHDSTGRPYITVKNCKRKSARGEVTIWGNGSGKIIINGHDITYFEEIHHREQVSCLFKFLEFNITFVDLYIIRTLSSYMRIFIIKL